MSSSALQPIARDDRLRPWGEGLHLASGIAHFGGLPVRNNTVVIELEDGLLVWNPIALTDGLRRSTRELEERTGRRVTVLLAGLDYHHRALPAWQVEFPDARTFLVSERIRTQRPEVRGDVIAGDRPVIPGCGDAIDVIAARGCSQPLIEWKGGPRNEWLVFHRKSRTLLIGDLLFIHARVTFAERLIGFRVGVTYNALGFRVGDRALRDAFLGEVLAWDFERALSVHGRASAHGGDFIRTEIRAATGLASR